MNLSSIVDQRFKVDDFAVVWHCGARQYDKTIDNEFTVADKKTHQCVGPKSEERSVFFKNLWITVINRSGKLAKIDASVRNNIRLLHSTDACNIKLNECKVGKIPAKVNPSNKQSYSLENSHEITLALYNNHTFNSECNDIRFTLEINEQVAYFCDFSFNKHDPSRNTKSRRLKEEQVTQERLIKFRNTEIHNPYYLEYAVKRTLTNQETLNKVLTFIPQQALANTPITNGVNTTVETVFKSNISDEENSTCNEENSSPLDSSTRYFSLKEKSSIRFHFYQPPLDLYNRYFSRKEKSSITFHPYKRPLT